LAAPEAAAAPHAGLAHHFHDLRQQRDAAELGMWLFIASEMMFFGGLFLAYLVYRWRYPSAFLEGSQHMNLWLGTINTAVLLTSSLTMALAVRAAELSQRRRLMQLLLVTAALGFVFLGVKAYEYHEKYTHHHVPIAGFEFDAHENGAVVFYSLYFAMTGLHALHIVIGLAMLLILAWLARRGGLTDESAITVHNAGLYWHLVDLVWVYLFPLFYLVGARLSRGE
jgi:cytochrome c oxidase subunit III